MGQNASPVNTPHISSVYNLPATAGMGVRVFLCGDTTITTVSAAAAAVSLSTTTTTTTTTAAAAP